MNLLPESCFNANEAMDIVRKLSFPRLIGSDGEAKAIQLTESLFNKIKLPLKREEFNATKFWMSFASQAGTFIIMLLTGLMVFLSVKAPAWNLFLISCIIIIAIICMRKMSGKSDLKVIGKKLRTANLVAKIPAKKSVIGKVIFMGHHDSKSQVLTTIQRTIGFTIGGAGLVIALIAFAAIGILSLYNIYLPVLSVIGYAGSGLMIVCAIHLSFNFLQNKSLGALDNASSIASLYEIAKYFKANPLRNCEMWFVITGAEEVGMMGAQAFFREHKSELDPETTYIINYDMAGRKGCEVEYIEKSGFPIPSPTCPRLNNLAKTIAKQYNYSIKGFYLPIGAATDAGALRSRGLNAMDFINKKASYETHSRKDVPDNYDPALAKKFTIIGASMACELDDRVIRQKAAAVKDNALSRKFPKWRSFPKVSFTRLPTPVERLVQTGKSLGMKNIWIKRDDLCSPKYGGNKPRKYEYIFAEAIRKKKHNTVTAGGIGSNHVLANSIYAKDLGLGSEIYLFDQPLTEHVRHNLLCDYKFDAKMHYTRNYVFTVLAILWKMITSRKQYLVMPGASTPLGTLGFVNAGLELAEQIKKGEMPEPDHLFTAVGSTGTCAGLLIGLELAGLKTKVHGIGVTVKLLTNKKQMLSLAKKTLKLMRKFDPAILDIFDKLANKIEVTHDFFGGEYGRVTYEGLAAINMAKKDGIKLEATYTGKAFSGLLAYCRENANIENEVILFWNTYNSADLSKKYLNTDYRLLPKSLHKFFDGTVELDEKPVKARKTF